jgi:hypothetical protein
MSVMIGASFAAVRCGDASRYHAPKGARKVGDPGTRGQALPAAVGNGYRAARERRREWLRAGAPGLCHLPGPGAILYTVQVSFRDRGVRRILVLTAELGSLMERGEAAFRYA